MRNPRGADATQQLIGLLNSLSGFWWDKRTGITLNSGNVSAWVDRLRAGSVSQGTASKQPSYSAATGLTFDGTDDYLVGAANCLQSAPGYTLWFCGSSSNNFGYVAAYNTSFNMGVYIDGTNLRAFLEVGATYNEWTSAVGCSSRAVYSAGGKWSDGTTAQKTPYKDGVAGGGSRTTSGDVSAGSFGAASLSFGAFVSGITACGVTMQHVVLVPSQVDATVIAMVSNLLHSIEGF